MIGPESEVPMLKLLLALACLGLVAVSYAATAQDGRVPLLSSEPRAS